MEEGERTGDYRLKEKRNSDKRKKFREDKAGEET